MSANVYLNDVLVGRLKPNIQEGTTTFEFDAAFAADARRPVLGRFFEDVEIGERIFVDKPLPNFFRNLLPEGALRKIIEARLGVSDLLEYKMLLRLGEQLPGAVRVVGDLIDPEPLDEEERKTRARGDSFRFALTGVQPKLLLERDDNDKLTIPIEGENGSWIGKFGTAAFKNLVENEFTMLKWAERSGLFVPEHRIARAEDIKGLPENFDAEQTVLLVKRFDRGPNGERIHQEDFAQVFNIAPEHKYVDELGDLGHINYASIGAIVFRLCGMDDYLEYLRRLVFMVLSGNGDAHVKNWALVYPDGEGCRLSPVYDFVSTIVYGQSRAAMRWTQPAEPTLLPPNNLSATSIDDVLLVASYTDADTNEIMDEITKFSECARDAWLDVASGAPPFLSRAVTKHLSDVDI